VSLLPVYKKYHNKIQFLNIYVREAHPTDKWWLAETKLMRVVGNKMNNLVSYDISEPKTIEERRIAAKACQTKLLGDMPVYVDNMDNKIDLQYVAWPTRVYMIDKNGKVIFNSGLGPYGLSHKELELRIKKYLAN